MAYDEIRGPGEVVGAPFVNGFPEAYQNWTRIHDNFEDHEDRLAVVEAGSGATLLTADPASPANDTFWVMRDGGSPQAVKLRVRIGGVSYTLAEITI